VSAPSLPTDASALSAKPTMREGITQMNRTSLSLTLLAIALLVVLVLIR
jgi:hypothetical protein